MKCLVLILMFIIIMPAAYSQALKNTSYINSSGEKVLRLEMTVPINRQAAWKIFTTDEKLTTWIAPLAHIELKAGGYLVTNYDTTKSLSDSSAILLPILSYIDQELLVLKVILNNNFAESVRASDKNLQEVIQFTSVDDQHTKIVSSMIGWGNSADWDKAYGFFVQGNEWTYKELLKQFKK